MDTAKAYRRFVVYGQYRQAIDSVRLTDGRRWNATSLDINAGFVYRSSSSRVQGSQMSKWRMWVNGGLGLGNSQILGQIGLYHQYAVTARDDAGRVLQPDSMFVISSLMYRLGNENFRLGIGGNLKISTGGTTHAGLTALTEIRLGRMIWAVAGLNGEFDKNSAPSWTPILTLKTTSGIFGL